MTYRQPTHAFLGRYAHEFDLRHLLEPLADLEAGGTGFAVDEDLGHCDLSYSRELIVTPTRCANLVRCTMIQSPFDSR
jgi:hypothetical protein